MNFQNLKASKGKIQVPIWAAADLCLPCSALWHFCTTLRRDKLARGCATWAPGRSKFVLTELGQLRGMERVGGRHFKGEGGQPPFPGASGQGLGEGQDMSIMSDPNPILGLAQALTAAKTISIYFTGKGHN